MFSCGALMATAFYLILPEALAMIQSDFFVDGHDGHNHRSLQQERGGEAAATWRFATAVIGGFLIPVVSHVLVPEAHDVIEEAKQEERREPSKDVVSKTLETLHETSFGDFAEPGSPEKGSDSEEHEPIGDATGLKEDIPVVMREDQPKRPRNWSLLASIFLGDFFHNFADGVFIGTAWLLCSRDLVYTIIAATIFHELAQEIADYFLMVHLCGLRPWQALVLNFVCGLSIMLGGILVLAFDLTAAAVGVVLCMGSGVYVHLAVAECLPTARRTQKTTLHKLYGLLAFVCGVVPIALVLLNHQHCD
jgi:zinc transporter ZupT